MRQVAFQIPPGQVERAMKIAEQYEAINVSRLPARGLNGKDHELVLLHVSNARVGPLIGDLQDISSLNVSFLPNPALALRPPAEEAPDQVTDVSARSPFEVYLAALQSIGSWKGFLAYSLIGGAVVWLGLLTNTVYLLVAAMLLAPFAGPAITTAIGCARGDLRLIWRSVLRYVVGLAVTAITSAVFTLVFQQSVVTPQLAETSNISAAAVVLPLAAGAAAALHLIQGQSNSLVSGAAVGLLVAASLAPPAGGIGMAAALGRWELIPGALFLLGLQLAGINLAGAAIFRLAGLESAGPRYAGGRSAVTWVSLVVTAIGLGALLFWQFGSPEPGLQRATLETRARGTVLQAVEVGQAVQAVSVDVRFTRSDVPEQNTLLITVYGQRQPAATGSEEALRTELTRRIQQAIEANYQNVTPLVDVTVLSPPVRS